MSRPSRWRHVKTIAIPTIILLAACAGLVIDGLRQRNGSLLQFEIPDDHSARAMLEFMRRADGTVELQESFFESSNLKEVSQAVAQAHNYLQLDAASLSTAEKREADFYKLRYAGASLQQGFAAVSEDSMSQLLSDTREFLCTAERLTFRESQLDMGTVILLDGLGRLEQEREFAEWMQPQLTKYSDSSNRSKDELTKMVNDVLSRLGCLDRKLELRSRTLDNEPFDLESLHGKVTLVEFWGTRCKPCIADIPALKRIYGQYHKQGFEIVAVCLNAAPSRISQFCNQYELPWIQLCHDQTAAEQCNDELMQRFGIQAIPTTMLVDKSGIVIAMGVRPLTADDGDLERWLEKLLLPVLTEAEKKKP